MRRQKFLPYNMCQFSFCKANIDFFLSVSYFTLSQNVGNEVTQNKIASHHPNVTQSWESVPSAGMLQHLGVCGTVQFGDVKQISKHTHVV